MSSIKYSEIFYSCQGEGPYTGRPSVWLRLWGCTLHCAGFGQENPADPSSYDMSFREYDPIANGDQSLDDLPIFAKGCDSEYSHNPRYNYLAAKDDVIGVADKLIALLPNGRFNQDYSDIHLCITGGECMMQQDQIVELIQELQSRNLGLKHVTFETNGTLELKPVLIDHMKDTTNGVICYHFSVSPKLFHITGELPAVAIKPHVINQYRMNADTLCLKFVLSNDHKAWEDLWAALSQLELYGIPKLPVWIMPLGGSLEEQQASAGDIANIALVHGFNISARMHVYLWGNKVGT